VAGGQEIMEGKSFSYRKSSLSWTSLGKFKIKNQSLVSSHRLIATCCRYFLFWGWVSLPAQYPRSRNPGRRARPSGAVRASPSLKNFEGSSRLLVSGLKRVRVARTHPQGFRKPKKPKKLKKLKKPEELRSFTEFTLSKENVFRMTPLRTQRY